MSDINLGVTVEGQANAVQQLQQITQAQAQVGTTAEQANRRAATSATQATSALTTMAQSGQQMAQRIQGAAGSVQALVSALGSDNRTAGLMASMAGATAQFAAMGSMLGPAGTVIGGIAGLIAGIAGAIQHENDLAARTAEANQALLQQANAAIQARQELERLNNLAAASEGGPLGSTFLTDSSSSDLARQAEEARGRVAAAREEVARRRHLEEDYHAVVGRRAVESVSERFASETRAAEEDVNRILATVSAIEAEIQRRYDEAGAAARATTERELAELDHRATEREAREEAAARRGGARRQQVEMEMWQARMAQLREERAVEEAALEEEVAATVAAMQRAFAESSGNTNGRGPQGFGDPTRRDGFRAAQDRRSPVGATSMFSEQADAMREFERGYVSSIDAVISAYDHLRDTSVAAANDVVRSGRFMERGMVAVGNNITEVVGGRMMGAFESALGAWLDGSKSFVEAAEAMAKGVIRSLVQEGIVQAVTETARGIADLASYQYATAGMHFAAAAAWGAVAGVAGAVGAATGSFGGSGAGAGGGPSQREMAERDRREDQGAGTTVINLYPGAFSTEDERANALRRALNYNARMGRRIDRRLVA